MRILTDIPDDDVEKLDALAARSKRSRAAAIRDAIRLYLLTNGDDRGWIERGYGLWADRSDIAEGVEYQRAVREDRKPVQEI
jgi:predicted transcriptional regulator